MKKSIALGSPESREEKKPIKVRKPVAKGEKKSAKMKLSYIDKKVHKAFSMATLR